MVSGGVCEPVCHGIVCTCTARPFLPDADLILRDEVMGIGELVEGMRVKMPSGDVFIVAEVSEPDATGAFTVTFDRNA